MQYYADCEFDGPTGILLSVALVSPKLVGPNLVLNKGIYMYAPCNYERVKDQWVIDNVIPLMYSTGGYASVNPGMAEGALRIVNVGNDNSVENAKEIMSKHLEDFFKGDGNIEIVVDWPADVKYISDLLITGPGKMIDIPSIKFEVRRVDAYPNNVKQAVQHNALWDAHMLMKHCSLRDVYVTLNEQRVPQESSGNYSRVFSTPKIIPK